MFKAFRVLLANELRGIVRTRISLFWVIIFPFLFLGMMIFSYGQRSLVGSAIVEVVDQDHSAASASYVAAIRKVLASKDPIGGEVRFVTAASPEQDGRVRVRIPARFGARISQQQPVAVRLDYKLDGDITTQVAARVLGPVTTSFNAQLAHAPTLVKLVRQERRGVSPILFPQYLLTGVLIMSMLSAGMNSACVSIADNREQNTFKLMACMPLGPTKYMAAMLMARLIMLFLSAVILLVGAKFVFGIELTLSPARLANAALVTLIGATMLLTLGIAMAARLASVATAAFLCNIVYLSLFFLGNLTMPMAGMSANLQAVVSTLPTAQFVAALRAVLIQGASLASQWRPLLGMAVWFALLLGFARATFQWHRT